GVPAAGYPMDWASERIGGHAVWLRTVAALAGMAALVAGMAALLAHPDTLQASDPAVRGAMETIVGLVALAGAWVAPLRAQRTGNPADVALAAGIGLVAANSALLVGITVFGGSGAGAIAWMAVPARIVAGALLLASGLPLRWRRR